MNREIQPFGRRAVLKTIGVGIVGGVTFTGSASAASDGLSHELNTVRAAVQKYRDVSVARQDGYGTVVPYISGMGYHFVNPDFIAPDESGPFNLETPPILVYFTTGDYDVNPGDVHDSTRDDDLRLAAVEFAHAGDNGAPGTPADIFSDEDSSRNLKVSEEDGWVFVPGANITAIHAWVSRGNPAGVFHPTNPTIE